MTGFGAAVGSFAQAILSLGFLALAVLVAFGLAMGPRPGTTIAETGAEEHGSEVGYVAELALAAFLFWLIFLLVRVS